MMSLPMRFRYFCVGREAAVGGAWEHERGEVWYTGRRRASGWNGRAVPLNGRRRLRSNYPIRWPQWGGHWRGRSRRKLGLGLGQNRGICPTCRHE